MSSPPFGATPLPAQSPGGPAQDATAGANASAAKRSPLVRFGVPIAAGLLIAGGLTAVLTGGPASDDADLEVGAPPPATATPEPEPSLEAPETLPVSTERNPFDPLVKEAPTGSGTGLGADGGGGTGIDTFPGLGGSLGSSGSSGSIGGSTGGSTGSSNGGSSSSGSSGSSSSSGSSKGSGGTSSGKGSGSGNGSGNGGQSSGNQVSSNQGSGTQGSGSKPAPPPGPAAPAKLDAVATCKAGDDLWATYFKAMQEDKTITHTMAGNTIGPVAAGVDQLAKTTTVDELRQPLTAWARGTASVRSQLVTGKAVREIEPSDPLKDSAGGAPINGTRPIVDQSSILIARTAVRERCYQLTDPLVAKGDL